jgi:hypothetical protein
MQPKNVKTFHPKSTFLTFRTFKIISISWHYPFKCGSLSERPRPHHHTGLYLLNSHIWGHGVGRKIPRTSLARKYLDAKIFLLSSMLHIFFGFYGSCTDEKDLFFYQLWSSMLYIFFGFYGSFQPTKTFFFQLWSFMLHIFIGFYGSIHTTKTFFFQLWSSMLHIFFRCNGSCTDHKDFFSSNSDSADIALAD